MTLRKIVLHGPTVDKLNRFRDAGETLIVGDTEAEDTDISLADAQQLRERGVAVSSTEAQAEEAAGALVTDEPLAGAGEAVQIPTADVATGEVIPPVAQDPLDHDGDGRKGGMKGVTPKAKRGA